MHSIALERFPLPQFYTYTIFSILSLISSILLASYIYFLNPNLSLTTTTLSSTSLFDNSSISSIAIINNNNNNNNNNNKLLNSTNQSQSVSPLEALFLNNGIFHFLYSDSWCFWSLINMLYCLLVWLGKSLQGELFGELHDVEQRHIRDKFWNFVFYRVIFLYGILNIQTPLESTLWTGWSSLLGFLHILTHLCKDRFEFLIQSNDLSNLSIDQQQQQQQHQAQQDQQPIIAKQWRIILLLVAVFTLGLLLGVVAILIGIFLCFHLMSFMLAEVIQLQVVTVYVVLRYSIHLRNNQSKSFLGNGEEIAWYDYNAMYYYKMTSWTIDLAHHIHMILWSSLRLNVSTLVILLHLQYLYQELSVNWKHHCEFERAVSLLNRGKEVYSKDDACAICWENLGKHRLLPCGHGFHTHCVLLWLSQSCTCPTCRQNLLFLQPNDPNLSDAFLSSKLSSSNNIKQSQQQQQQVNKSELNTTTVAVVATTSVAIVSSNNPTAMESSTASTTDVSSCCHEDTKLFSETRGNCTDAGQDSIVHLSFNTPPTSSPQLLTGPMQVELDWHGGFIHCPHGKHSS